MLEVCTGFFIGTTRIESHIAQAEAIDADGLARPPQTGAQTLHEVFIWRNTMHTYLENAPSKTGNPSGGGRGNNPPRGK